jgi:hypothetical protein
MGGRVSVLRKKDGEVKVVDVDRCIFTKDGVYFTLGENQMRELPALIAGILGGGLRQIDPASKDMVLAD